MLLFLTYFMACETEKQCPEGMVSFSDTKTTVGSKTPARSWHTPAKDVALEAFCIDQYEYPNKKGEYPKNNVTWEEAKSLCEAEGKRLCSSAEWELACRGTEGRKYSYGNVYDRNKCNTPIDGPGPQGRNPPFARSGSYEDCHSPEGVYDLNGSMSEWVSDPWSDFAEPFAKNVTVDPENWRELRGGTMWSHTFYGQDCTSRHGHKKTKWKNMDDGFRCCMNR